MSELAQLAVAGCPSNFSYVQSMSSRRFSRNVVFDVGISE